MHLAGAKELISGHFSFKVARFFACAIAVRMREK
jgi:hypothetical protein